MARSSLKVVNPTSGTTPEPPGDLGPTGRGIWDGILAEFLFDTRSALETLFQACAAADRAAELRAVIDRDGPVIYTKAGMRDHPALKHELANRAFVVRSLARLGCDLEPVGPIGRPPGR
jgi:hypothetical protein